MNARIVDTHLKFKDIKMTAKDTSTMSWKECLVTSAVLKIFVEKLLREGKTNPKAFDLFK